MTSAIDTIFEALFFGSGSWLGLLLFVTLCLAPCFKWKEASILFLPISIFLGVAYIDKDLYWHAIIMLLTGLFTVFLLTKKGKD